MLNKGAIYGSQRCEASSSEDENEEVKKAKEPKEEVWYKARRDEIKLIDFGGATYENEHHTAIINTRQYRAPEVILSKD